MGRPNPSRETKFSGANGDSEIFIFQPSPVDPYSSICVDHRYTWNNEIILF